MLWQLTNHQCGLIDNLNILEKSKAEFLEMQIDNINKTNVVEKSMLGFNKINKNIYENKYSVLFDTPPEMHWDFAISNPIKFTYVGSVDFCKQFLNDFYNVQKISIIKYF